MLKDYFIILFQFLIFPETHLKRLFSINFKPEKAFKRFLLPILLASFLLSIINKLIPFQVQDFLIGAFISIISCIVLPTILLFLILNFAILLSLFFKLQINKNQIKLGTLVSFLALFIAQFITILLPYNFIFLICSSYGAYILFSGLKQHEKSVNIKLVFFSLIIFIVSIYLWNAFQLIINVVFFSLISFQLK